MITSSVGSELSDQKQDQPAKKSEYPSEFDPDFWDAFLPDDELETEPLPELGDFWMDQDPEDSLLSPLSQISLLKKENSPCCR